jgi:hypothetical protein
VGLKNEIISCCGDVRGDGKNKIAHCEDVCGHGIPIKLCGVCVEQYGYSESGDSHPMHLCLRMWLSSLAFLAAVTAMSQYIVNILWSRCLVIYSACIGSTDCSPGTTKTNWNCMLKSDLSKKEMGQLHRIWHTVSESNVLWHQAHSSRWIVMSNIHLTQRQTMSTAYVHLEGMCVYFPIWLLTCTSDIPWQTLPINLCIAVLPCNSVRGQINLSSKSADSVPAPFKGMRLPPVIAESLGAMCSSKSHGYNDLYFMGSWRASFKHISICKTMQSMKTGNISKTLCCCFTTIGGHMLVPNQLVLFLNHVL